MRNKFDVIDSLSLFGFFCVIGFLHWMFSYIWEIEYFEWYLRNGTASSWVMSLVALTYGNLEKNPFLISSKPGEYVGGHALLFSEVFLTLAIFGAVKRKSEDELPITSYWNLDQLMAIILNVAFGTLILCWLLVIAPIQYFLFIICGAPARTIICSQQSIDKEDLKWWANGISERPIAVTAGFTGMVIWILKLIFLDS